ncbi:hypothetical protein [Fodinibius salsisoli]|uniref:Lipoprotein with Yx(FWY)xxD motif n=1 Tax=Fodinibius salsisoli TaxID=2820877 RepID=A0ABT3PK93_9BACT|nr:hypothetical protein [Fodinibius salsisoli]MCW9706337.1 hypothetical protein [Fodinibius salsisoli]
MTIRNIKYFWFARTTAFFVLVAAIGAGCGDNSTDPDPSGEFDVQVSSTSSHGDILTDGEGNALYVFTLDVKGESLCEGDCVASWPVFHTENPQLGEGLDAQNFGTITRSDGSSQTTFAGWPLYYFSGDGQPGSINGDGVNNVWYVVKPDYSLMMASQQLVGEDGVNYRVDDSGSYVEGDEMTNHIVDIQGRTLYTFVNDSANTNNFTAEDFSNNGVWPIVEMELDNIPSNLDASHFSTIDVYGRQQLTYKGWPLYYFGQDEMQRGNTRGVSFPQPGIWPVVQIGMEAAPGYNSDNNNNDDTNDPDY